MIDTTSWRNSASAALRSGRIRLAQHLLDEKSQALPYRLGGPSSPRERLPDCRDMGAQAIQLFAHVEPVRQDRDLLGNPLLVDKCTARQLSYRVAELVALPNQALRRPRGDPRRRRLDEVEALRHVLCEPAPPPSASPQGARRRLDDCQELRHTPTMRAARSLTVIGAVGPRRLQDVRHAQHRRQIDLAAKIVAGLQRNELPHVGGETLLIDRRRAVIGSPIDPDDRRNVAAGDVLAEGLADIPFHWP